MVQGLKNILYLLFFWVAFVLHGMYRNLCSYNKTFQLNSEVSIKLGKILLEVNAIISLKKEKKEKRD